MNTVANGAGGANVVKKPRTARTGGFTPPPREAHAMPTVLITGANRGLGLEFTRQYVARKWQVVATCRDPAGAADLAALAREHAGVAVERLDVTDHAGMDRLAAALAGRPLDLLLLNAAYLGPLAGQKCGALDYALFERSFAANATGPMKVAEAFIPHVAAGTGRKIVFLGSGAGSIGLLKPPVNLYAYRASKAAMHLLARNLALDLAPRGIHVGIVNPGLADTRGLLKLAPDEAPPPDLAPVVALVRAGVVKMVTAEESVRGMIGVIDRLDAAGAGTFVNYDGAPIPW